jgi:hypothetical protein
MASIGDLFDNGATKSLAVGIGAIVAAPVVIPAVAAFARPLVKGVIKTGFVCYEKGREMVGDMGEVFGDLVAEARVELEHAKSMEGEPPTRSSEDKDTGKNGKRSSSNK